jgi:hypothetical protein
VFCPPPNLGASTFSIAPDRRYTGDRRSPKPFGRITPDTRVIFAELLARYAEKITRVSLVRYLEVASSGRFLVTPRAEVTRRYGGHRTSSRGPQPLSSPWCDARDSSSLAWLSPRLHEAHKTPTSRRSRRSPHWKPTDKTGLHGTRRHGCYHGRVSLLTSMNAVERS